MGSSNGGAAPNTTATLTSGSAVSSSLTRAFSLVNSLSWGLASAGASHSSGKRLTARPWRDAKAIGSISWLKKTLRPSGTPRSCNTCATTLASPSSGSKSSSLSQSMRAEGARARSTEGGPSVRRMDVPESAAGSTKRRNSRARFPSRPSRFRLSISCRTCGTTSSSILEPRFSSPHGSSRNDRPLEWDHTVDKENSIVVAMIKPCGSRHFEPHFHSWAIEQVALSDLSLQVCR